MENFVVNTRQLLLLEREEEKKQLSDKLQTLSAIQCEKAGLSLLNLDVLSVSTGLYGRTCYSVGRILNKGVASSEKTKIAGMSTPPLPAHGFKVGDEIVLYAVKLRFTPQADASMVSGIVSRVSKTSLDFVVSEDTDGVDLSCLPLRLDMLSNESTHNKMMSCLSSMLSGIYDHPGGILAQMLFDGLPVKQGEPYVLKKLFNPNLNSSQRHAVEHALGSPNLSLIHGPPGTGKTTAVTELIMQAVLEKKWKVLVVAASNVAVDNVLSKLIDMFANSPGSKSKGSSSSSSSGGGDKQTSERLRAIRIGHPARLTDAVKPFCLDALIASHDGTEVVADVRQEIDSLRAKTESKGKRPKKQAHMSFKEIRSELKSLRKELRTREQKIVSEILRSRDVVLCTCIGASSHFLREMSFDLVVIDEAAQALEVACWVAMMKVGGLACLFFFSSSSLSLPSSQMQRAIHHSTYRNPPSILS
jgi:hypothetical protein